MIRPDALLLLSFASSFLWSDLEVAPEERRFFAELAEELGLSAGEAARLLARPPYAEDVDPTRVSPRLAAAVREVSLRAIASDGRVRKREMALFHLLDELLPPGDGAPGASASAR